MAQHDDKEAQQVARRLGKVAKEQAALRELGLREMLGSVAGREFLWEILSMCGVGQIPWAPASDRETAFLIGGLNVGHQLLARIAEIDPLAYALMQKEHIERERPSERPDSQSADPSGEPDA